MRSATWLAALLFALSTVAGPGLAQEGGQATRDAAIDGHVARGIELLLGMQEGEGRREWPYEGVYRVRGQIPIGYRVGGTGIVALALIQAPGYAQDEARVEAVRRAMEFVAGSVDHPLMDPDYDGGYDVRGWAYCYGLAFLLKLKGMELVPDDVGTEVDDACRFFVDSLQAIEIPANGGWSYSRGRRIGDASPPSPFMTAPCVQTLIAAEQAGYEVDPAIVERGLDVLERARTASGAVVYSLRGRGRSNRDVVPGSVGRMLAAESTLYLAGRNTQVHVRGAIDAFLVHWRWLEDRRCKTGTHEGPYGIAPYYFFYAHYFAAQAVELLPAAEREEYRARVDELLLSVQLEDGSWNDRVFDRSASYGTAMALLALMMPELEPPAAWTRGAAGR